MSLDLLPRALLPWEPWLRMFPEDLALTLGDWIEKLALGLGPLSLQSQSKPVEPEGYSGLTRKGSYERLLTSEWALADAAPDEFLRRAASSEHLFYHLSSSEPAGSRRSVALLDVGPSQLGGPHLVQLAAIIALARRAEAAGASFLWGILQQAEGELWGVVGPESLSSLVKARHRTSPRPSELEAWLKRLGKPLQKDDLWLLGGPSLERLAPPGLQASILELADPLEPGQSIVRTRFRQPTRSELRIELQLPKPEDCIRLLRNPFRPSSPVVKSSYKLDGTGMRFSFNDTRLLLPEGDKTILAFAIPQSLKDKGRTTRITLKPEERFIAIGWYRSRFIAAALSEDSSIALYGLGAPNPAIPTDATLALPPPSCLPPQCWHWKSKDFYFLDAERRLFRVSPQGRAAPQLLREGILANSPIFGNTNEFAILSQEERLTLRQGTNQDKILEPESPDLPIQQAHCFGLGGLMTPQNPSLIACRTEPKAWQIFTRTRTSSSTLSLQPPAGDQVFGVVTASNALGEPQLLAIGQDRKSLWLHGASKSERLLQTAQPIREACASSISDRIAYQTENGSITVQSVWNRSLALQISREPG